MVKFFTFCVYIGRHPKKALNRALSLLIESLKANLPVFELTIYTNYEIPVPSGDNISVRTYYDCSKKKLYDGSEHNAGSAITNKWLNLSFNKIQIYKDLHDEHKEDYTWIDLDTIIVGDISYIETLPNLFLEHGGREFKKPWYPFRNNQSLSIPQESQIQGNLWKLTIDLYRDLMGWFKIIQKQGLVLNYDTQDLFNSYIYIRTNGRIPDGIYILGLNYLPDTVNGLAIWSDPLYGLTKHATRHGLAQLYRDKEEHMRSKFHPDKQIQILSFTFITLRRTWNSPEFQTLFG